MSSHHSHILEAFSSQFPGPLPPACPPVTRSLLGPLFLHSSVAQGPVRDLSFPAPPWHLIHSGVLVTIYRLMTPKPTHLVQMSFPDTRPF